MRNAGYFRAPTVDGGTVVFVAEDDLWTVPLAGGLARRLTAGLGAVGRPALSPDGALIAFTSQEEQHPEVYVMPSEGGQSRRVTFLGATTSVAGWTPKGAIVFRSDTAQPFMGRRLELHTVDPAGGVTRRLSYGWANDVSFGGDAGVVLGRNTLDPATWKRYRGGRAGKVWIDPKGSGTFKELIRLDGNLASPMWVGKRIYFLSDHEGYGNIYSCTPTGKGLRRHTDHGEYYARIASTDGATIVYQHGADIWALDVETDVPRRVEIDFPSPRTQRNRTFRDATEFLHGFEVHPDGHSLAIETRGKVFTMGLWEGGVREFGIPSGVRYRDAQWLHDGRRIVLVSDEGGADALEVHGTGRGKRYGKLDLGRIVEVVANPKKDIVAVTTHRLEVFLVDLKTGKATLIERNRFGRPNGLTWSPDGAWLAYSSSVTNETRSIMLANATTAKTHVVTRPEFNDFGPSFDPDGNYLYFLSLRSFDPIYDAHFFDLGFPRGARPYLVTLRKDAPRPFMPEPKGFGKKKTEDPADVETKKAEKPKPFHIDLAGIDDRVAMFPVPESRYGQIQGIKGKAVFTSFPAQGSLGTDIAAPEGERGRGTLETFSFEEQKHEVIAFGVSGFRVSRDGSTLVLVSARRLRAMRAGEKPDDKTEKDPPSRKSGWIDLNRVRVSVDPAAEWRQMYNEAWRLQVENFWTKDMSGVDWPRVRDRYLPLVEKVATRLEFSDLIWEMQAELGTSHCYEMGGDHRRPPAYTLGHLGADLLLGRDGRYRIDHIVRGDAWDETKTSPLALPGVNVREGDRLLAINGRDVGKDLAPQALLVNQAGQIVELTIGDAAGKKTRTVAVRTLREEYSARYREWVERARAHVHAETKGRVGYVHIPNMGPLGYSEFHRYYLSEVGYDGLLVDVRFNGGGHVSQILLEKLARKRIGYDIPRWGEPVPYPGESVLGPMVCLTNESAGSDGDIFTHCFKLMKLGPVVGKRTWGGVVGIGPRVGFVDGGLTTQPEYSFWFRDVGWGVENYGTDPDYDVDITPQDYAAGRDPQMAKALSLILAEMKRRPPTVPDFSKRPSLRLPKLPARRVMR